MNRTFVSLGAWLALVGVGLGAFGTHALRDRLTPAAMDVWHTGTQYHLIHAIALVVVGIACAHTEARLVRTAGWLFTAGIVIFGGSLYALALTDVKILGAITPLGGLCFLSGWACLALGAKQQ